MKPIRNIFSALLGFALMAGCSAADEPLSDAPIDGGAAGTDGAAGHCTLVVAVMAGEADGETSRAADFPWSDPYPAEDAIGNESAIDILDLFFVTTSGRTIAMAPERISAVEGFYVYKFAVNMDADFVSENADGVKSLDGRIVALANYPGGTPSNPFTAEPYSIGEIARADGLIPMWGVASIGPVRLVDGQTVDVGSVRLLRSVPKVSIDLGEELGDDFMITGVEPEADDYNTMAYCQPAGAASAQSTVSLLVDGCFNATSRSTGALAVVYGLNSESVRFYTAERELGGVVIPRYLDVTIARRDGTGTPFQGRVYLCDYSDGRPDFSTAFNRLVRNHDYRYVISLSELEFKISFREWVFGGKVHIELE